MNAVRERNSSSIRRDLRWWERAATQRSIFRADGRRSPARPLCIGAP